MSGPLIEAAGGVLWRPAAGAESAAVDGPAEVAVIHRPRYDDWSLPKGKLDTGEHPLAAALREVEEETGSRTRAGRFLVETRYESRGQPKRVRYWALRHVDGAFRPNHEVDEVRWLSPGAARAYLAADHDRPVLDAFTRAPVTTVPCLLLRHASAGERSTWAGPDRDRPLDEHGRAQAAALVPVLMAYGVERVLSADYRRCLDTVAPFAKAARVPVEPEPLLSEAGFPRDPSAARRSLLDILTSARPSLLCSQRGVVEDLVEHSCRALGHPPPDVPALDKGGMWALHGLSGPDGARLVAVDRLDPPA